MERIPRTHIMALLLAMILTGCIPEKEPNDSTAEAQANNAPPLFEPGASQGALFLGTKETQWAR
jgi:PBP1b-binding outer membrane lipoprotein LpoB